MVLSGTTERYQLLGRKSQILLVSKYSTCTERLLCHSGFPQTAPWCHCIAYETRNPDPKGYGMEGSSSRGHGTRCFSLGSSVPLLHHATIFLRVKVRARAMDSEESTTQPKKWQRQGRSLSKEEEGDPASPAEGILGSSA